MKELEANLLNKKDKYLNWGFGSLYTQFKHMLNNNKYPQREITGIVFAMLDILGVKVRDKKDKPTFAIASKVRKCGDKHSADLLWKMWVLKQDGMLTSPDGYLYKVINSIQGGK